MFRNKIQTLSAISLGLALLCPVSVQAHGNEKHAAPALFVGESTAAAQAVKAFHQALRLVMPMLPAPCWQMTY